MPSSATTATRSYTLSLHTLFRSGADGVKAYAASPVLHLVAGQPHTLHITFEATHPFDSLDPGTLLLEWKTPAGTTSPGIQAAVTARSEEHTSELQSQFHLVCRLLLRRPPGPTLFPYTRSSDLARTVSRPMRPPPCCTWSPASRTPCTSPSRPPTRSTAWTPAPCCWSGRRRPAPPRRASRRRSPRDRKSTRLNSSHSSISYAVFCYDGHPVLHSFPTHALPIWRGRCQGLCGLPRAAPGRRPAAHPAHHLRGHPPVRQPGPRHPAAGVEDAGRHHLAGHPGGGHREIGRAHV